ncbi:MAG: peptidylprolyl isomerase, partial [Deltaproteobacteria bacterium]|nr:peptidylprolyl isomerase [Deltaproteobacteria bacterium]
SLRRVFLLGVSSLRRVFLLGVSLCVLGGMVSFAEAKIIERIVAVVNKDIVLLSDLQERVAPMLSRLGQLPPEQRKPRLAELEKQILGQMVDQKLIEAQARKLKITVRDRDLELAIKDVMRKNKLTREKLEEALRREGKSILAYKAQILRPQLLRLKVLNLQVRPRVSVGEEEVKALYDKNLRALGVETKVRARHIFVAIPAKATKAQIASVRGKAMKILEAIKKGTDFATLAKKMSNDSVTRASGGDLGYFGKGTLPPSVEDVVFGMKKGEVRGPLRTERGFHVMKLIDRQESSARAYKEVRRRLKGQVFGKKMETATKAWLKEVRKRSYVDIRL